MEFWNSYRKFYFLILVTCTILLSSVINRTRRLGSSIIENNFVLSFTLYHFLGITWPSSMKHPVESVRKNSST